MQYQRSKQDQTLARQTLAPSVFSLRPTIKHSERPNLVVCICTYRHITWNYDDFNHAVTNIVNIKGFYWCVMKYPKFKAQRSNPWGSCCQKYAQYSTKLFFSVYFTEQHYKFRPRWSVSDNIGYSYIGSHQRHFYSRWNYLASKTTSLFLSHFLTQECLEWLISCLCKLELLESGKFSI